MIDPMTQVKDDETMPLSTPPRYALATLADAQAVAQVWLHNAMTPGRIAPPRGDGSGSAPRVTTSGMENA